MTQTNKQVPFTDTKTGVPFKIIKVTKPDKVTNGNSNGNGKGNNEKK